MFPEKNMAALLLGSWKAADKLYEMNPEKFPSGYQPRPEIKPKNQNTQTNEES